MVSAKSPLLDQETLGYIEIILDELQKVNVEFSKAEQNNSAPELHTISRIIHSIKGSSGCCGLSFAPILCHNIEEALLKIKESGFTPDQVELTTNLISLLEDYFIAKKNNFASEDEDFAMRMHALFGKLGGHTQNQALSGLRGLVVDDSNTVAKKIINTLNEQGVFCSHASNGLEALNRLTDEYFDFVITGHHTKKINGFELIEMLSISKGKNSNLKTCLISSAENLTPLKKTASLVLQKNSSLTQNLISFLLNEFKAKAVKLPVKSFQKILLVDDDPVIRILLKSVFAKEADLQVEIVSSGAEALNKVQSFTPEIIVLDYMMPELSGGETLKVLKVLKQLKETRFFFLTGKSRPEEILELLSLGAHGVLAKPIAPERLVNLLKDKYNAAV